MPGWRSGPQPLEAEMGACFWNDKPPARRRRPPGLVKDPVPKEILPLQKEATPRLVRRARDLGWLAVSPDDCRIQIGVTGDTAESAAQAFGESYAKWFDLFTANQPATAL
jgi:hypothetical protein